MKHAYLIIAHNNWWQLSQCLSTLDDENNDIYLHIDAKGGVPTKMIGRFDDIFEKRRNDPSASDKTIQKIWELFEEMRKWKNG